MHTATHLHRVAHERELPPLAKRFAAFGKALLGHLRWCLHTPGAQVLVLEQPPHAALVTLLELPTGTVVLRWAGTSPAAVAALGPTLIDVRPTGTPRLLVQCGPAEALHWEQLGLAEQAALETWAPDTANGFTEAQDEAVVLLEPTHRMALLHLDARATGEDRTTLLLEHHYAARVYVERARVRGALLPLLGNGLILADHAHAGLELLRWLLPVQQRPVVPEGNTAAAEQLTAWNYCVVHTSIRLVLGPVPPFRPELIYAWPWP
jgi:hypothetical protein